MKEERDLNIWFAELSFAQKKELFDLWKLHHNDQKGFIANDLQKYSFTQKLITKRTASCGFSTRIYSNFFLEENNPVVIKFLKVTAGGYQFGVQDEINPQLNRLVLDGSITGFAQHSLSDNYYMKLLPSELKNGDILSITRHNGQFIFRAQRSNQLYQTKVGMRDESGREMNQNKIKVLFALSQVNDKIQILKC